ncbi:MAG: hypothetical protein CSA22_03110 [Deltaproteobacteria bacterium]|nr:MAG: hypothetical protein CSA22_03110 [Deltaproteobacteria bacterium]
MNVTRSEQGKPVCLINDAMDAAPLTPQRLAAAGGGWAADADDWGPWQSAAGVWQGRAAGAANRQIRVVGEIPSTMGAARTCMERGALSPGDAILALSQTSGRGRMGSTWDSPAGNLYVSWRWMPLGGGSDGPWKQWASLLVGYGLVRSLEDAVPGLAVKWPNDLVRKADRTGNRVEKLGGILVEARDETILVGLGINLCSAPALTPQAGPVPGILPPPFRDMGPLSFWVWLFPRLQDAMNRMAADGRPSALFAALNRRLIWKGRQVVLTSGHTRACGVLAGVADDGGLIIDSRRETERVRMIYYTGRLRLASEGLS